MSILRLDCSDPCAMDDTPNGQYVSYDDYAELEAKLAAIKADARELLKGDYNAAYDLKNDLRALLGIDESEES